MFSESAIDQHLLDNPMCAKNYSDGKFTILSFGRLSFHLFALEAVYIVVSSSPQTVFRACICSILPIFPRLYFFTRYISLAADSACSTIPLGPQCLPAPRTTACNNLEFLIFFMYCLSVVPSPLLIVG